MQAHQEMVTRLAKPGQAILDTMTPAKAHLLHMAIGISGEAGELVAGLATYDRATQNLRAVADCYENILEELGDIEFYVEGLRQGVGLTHGGIAKILMDGANEDAVEVSYDLAEGITIYSANILDTVKKHVIYNKGLDGKALIDDLCGLEYHLEEVRALAGVSREDTLEHNIAKLTGDKGRYKQGYSDKAAQERADKQ
jgi:NTP pyrophosphatase (non-canonical NTP hydrolase)